MRIPTWRLVLTGGAITVLAAAGLGFAAASSTPSAPAANVAAVESTAAPGAAGPLAGLRNRLGAGRLLRIGRHLVHAEVTVNRDGQLVNVQLDHGTVQSIGGGKLTIAEAGGTTVTVSTSDATKVHLGRADGKLADVKVGAEVFVRSLIGGGSTLAKGILVVPAAAT
jgi:hypothetical protein